MSYNVPDWYLNDDSIPTNRRLTAVNSFNVDPFSVEELTWENGQLLVNEIGPGLTRPGSEAVVGTLESIVDLATQKQPLSLTKGDSEDIDVPWLDFRHVSSSGGSSATSMTDALVPCAPTEEEQHQRIHNVVLPSQRINVCFEDGTTRESRHFSSVDTCEKDSGRGFGVETASLWSQGLSISEMPDNYTNNSTMHDDSFCLTRPQKRRDMINQKMKTLQKLVPNSSKTDKSSMLDEVIEYLKQLQSQVHMMNMSRMSMMMPFTMPQHPYNMPMNMMHPLMGMDMNMINSIMAHQNLANLSPLVNPSVAFMRMVATDQTAFDPSAYLASRQSQPVSIEAYVKMIALIQQQQQLQLASNKN